MYINLKFVCDNGGAQNRSLKTYHFVHAQLNHIREKGTGEKHKFFVNILDRDTSSKCMNKFNHLLMKYDEDIRRNVFVGDIPNICNLLEIYFLSLMY